MGNYHLKLPINQIIEGDSLEILKKFPDESVDLVLTDPPFGINYDKWDKKDFTWFENWIKECFRLLKNNGSFYIFSNWKKIAELKLLCDKYGIIQNWIIWCYRNGGATKKRWARKHTDILFYTKSNDYKFNPQRHRLYYDKEFFRKYKKDKKGRIYVDTLMTDWWDDIPSLINVSKERKYNWDNKHKAIIKTQKPIALIERIILASSKENDLILDPFIGSGTTAVACKKLKRNYIGIDLSPNYCKMAEERIRNQPFPLL